MISEPWYIESDAKIRAGAFSQARWIVDSRVEMGLEREELVLAAEIYRRLGSPGTGIRLLAPVVRPGGRKGSGEPSSDGERAEYAGNLIRLGATAEAKRHLATVDESRAPMRAVFEGLAFIHEWDFQAAIAPLTRAFHSRSLSDYAKLIAGVNLGQSYLHSERHSEARNLFQNLSEKTRVGNLNFLHLNLESLSAMNEILDPEVLKSTQAKTHLGIGLKLAERMTSEGSYDALVLKKAEALIHLKEKGATSNLLRVREEGVRFHQPEIVRDCDLQLAISQKDTDLLNRIYFQTPFSAYRLRIERLAIRAGLSIADSWVGGVPSASREPWDHAFDPALKPGQALSRLFRIFLEEGYRNFTVTNLATEVFPNSYLNLNTSPDQIHQLLKRARTFLRESGLPLEIESQAGEFRLKRGDGFSVLHRKKESTDSELTARLRERFKCLEFTAREAGELLGLGQQHFSRILRQEEASGTIVRKGAGKATRYSFRKNGAVK